MIATEKLRRCLRAAVLRAGLLLAHGDHNGVSEERDLA
jgi:hypothetical protein